MLLQPALLDDVWEFPVGFFYDYPGHRRHLQLGACSNAEMEHVLMQAWQAGWHSVVLVSHSHELIHRPHHFSEPVRANQTVIRRFDRLCRFLMQHSDKFNTAGFSASNPVALPAQEALTALRSGVRRTALRMLEQATSRFRDAKIFNPSV